MGNSKADGLAKATLKVYRREGLETAYLIQIEMPD